MDHLLFNCQWKAAAAGDPGELDGYMSTFGNVDHGGDVVRPGAFKKTFSDWSRAKSPMPLIADHQLSTDGVIGSVTKMAEDSHGARIKARFSSIQKAQDIRTRMLEGHLSGMSFTYEPVKFSFGQQDGYDVRYLDEVKVYEATVTPFPMNELAVASAKVSALAGASKPYGDVSYADPGYLDSAGNQASTSGNTPQARYPLDTEAHCRAAWSYFHQGNNAAAYTSSQRSTVEGRIRSALEQYGVTVAQSSSYDLYLEPNLRVALELPDPALRKSTVQAVLASYQPDPAAADETDGSVTADTAADTDPAVDTVEPDYGYATQFVTYQPPEPSDGTLDALAALEAALEIERFEIGIQDVLGRSQPE